MYSEYPTFSNITSAVFSARDDVLQVACLLLDDPVPNRIHWPRLAELKINSMVYRPYGRNSNTKLGGNARDEPANAAHRCAAGTNRVQLTCVEDRPFCEYPSLTPYTHSSLVLYA